MRIGTRWRPAAPDRHVLAAASRRSRGREAASEAGRTAARRRPGRGARRAPAGPGPTEVLVRTVASVISPGTERAVTALAQSSLLAKARARPDLVRQVVRKARADGIAATTQAVRSRLAQDLPLGYSAAGIVLEAGAAVDRGPARPAGRDRRGGQGQPRRIPGRPRPAVRHRSRTACPPRTRRSPPSPSIALHGLRLAEVGPGAKVVVLGLGLIGQLAARLAMAAGCDVAGIDPAARIARRVAAKLRGAGPGRVRVMPPPTRCSPGPAAGARTQCWSARPAGPRTR